MKAPRPIIALALAGSALLFADGSASAYTIVKAGGYGLNELAGGSPVDGLFLGIEAGAAPSRHLQIGITGDWLRRRQGTNEILLVDAPYELPVEGVLELESNATDLVPLGGILRLRFPMSEGRLVPFISGQLTYDILRLRYRELSLSNSFVREQTEYFTGTGTTLSAGIEAPLDRKVGLLFEAGYHESRPDKEIELGGLPVRARVDASGAFARFGLRLGLS